MDLEEAIENLKEYKNIQEFITENGSYGNTNLLNNSIETVLKALEEIYINSLTKAVNESIKNREKNKEDLDLLNEGWKIREKELLEKLENSVSKDIIREKIEELNRKIKFNKKELEKNPDPINSKFYSFDEYFKWKNKLLKEIEISKIQLKYYKELL